MGRAYNGFIWVGAETIGGLPGLYLHVAFFSLLRSQFFLLRSVHLLGGVAVLPADAAKTSLEAVAQLLAASGVAAAQVTVVAGTPNFVIVAAPTVGHSWPVSVGPRLHLVFASSGTRVEQLLAPLQVLFVSVGGLALAFQVVGMIFLAQAD